MRALVLLAVLLPAPSVRAADPPTPTKEESDDIRHQVKQLAVYVYSPPELLKACEALSSYGPKASSAVPALVAVIDSPDHKSEGVQAAAAEAIAVIGGPAATKALTALAKHKAEGVRQAAERGLAAAKIAAHVDLIRAGDKSPERMRMVAEFFADERMKKWDDIANFDRWLSPRYRLALLLLDHANESPELKLSVESVLVARLAVAFVAEGWLGWLTPDKNKKFVERESGDELERLVCDVRVSLDAAVARAGVEGKTLAVQALIKANELDGKNQVEDVKSLKGELASDNPLTRARAVARLVPVGGKAAVDARPDLKALLKDKSPLVAAVAADAIARLEKK